MCIAPGAAAAWARTLCGALRMPARACCANATVPAAAPCRHRELSRQLSRQLSAGPPNLSRASAPLPGLRSLSLQRPGTMGECSSPPPRRPLHCCVLSRPGLLPPLHWPPTGRVPAPTFGHSSLVRRHQSTGMHLRHMILCPLPPRFCAARAPSLGRPSVGVPPSPRCPPSPGSPRLGSSLGTPRDASLQVRAPTCTAGSPLSHAALHGRQKLGLQQLPLDS